jgi:hypothetical protein
MRPLLPYPGFHPFHHIRTTRYRGRQHEQHSTPIAASRQASYTAPHRWSTRLAPRAPFDIARLNAPADFPHIAPLPPRADTVHLHSRETNSPRKEKPPPGGNVFVPSRGEDPPHLPGCVPLHAGRRSDHLPYRLVVTPPSCPSPNGRLQTLVRYSGVARRGAACGMSSAGGPDGCGACAGVGGERG